MTVVGGALLVGVDGSLAGVMPIGISWKNWKSVPILPNIANTVKLASTTRHDESAIKKRRSQV